MVAACSPAQRVVAGGGIAAAGAGLTYLALESMTGSCREHTDPREVCFSSYESTPPGAAWPVAAGGLGIAFLGGVVMATGMENSRPARAGTRAAPSPSENPTALKQTEAIGMAVARLVVRGGPPVPRINAVGVGINTKSKPAKLIDVDHSQSNLHVEGLHAELWNLRVRTAADKTWRTVGACYEYENEWRLTSLRMTPGCWP